MRQFNKTSNFGKRESNRPERRESDGPKRRSFGRPEGRTFDRSNRPEGRFDRRDSDRPRNRSSGIELHKVVCDKCGVTCEVPFKPVNNRPVYCRECFKKNESPEQSNKFEGRGKSNDRFESKSNPSSEELEKINRKLDKIMRALKIE